MSWNESVERLKQRLHRRAHAYRSLFLTPGADIAPAAAIVLKDLARYCYASKPTLKVSPITGSSDPLAMAFAEGRRDVFNRITALCELTDDQIQRIANSKGNDE
ncbi:hypothetical protein C1M51_02825 [Methylibium sp. Pch-M]|uniref:Bbp19 family protein n=1 Tax=Methylibium sp. Pch-M TaxID=2082386 RepID=UPI0010107641|nr:hypothetical protein [Methylibium sp. Pch-M]QAZ38438.1 hypothetical protein C1M51_02825 [Methylibium sp. Pch-M]